MLPQIELFCVGFAAVVDTVLLLVVLERVNRPLTAIWLKWTLIGATLWHVVSFLRALLRDTDGAMALRLDSLCMITMTGGLLLLNCGILHAGLRVNRTGSVSHPPRSWRYIGVYAPSMSIIVVAATIVRSGSRDFIEATNTYHLPYLMWLTFANLTAAVLFFKNRHRFAETSASARRFLVKFSVGIIGITVVANAYVLTLNNSTYEPILRLLTNLSPLVPTLVFAYYVFRRRLLPMVFERTLVYGAILLSVFYFHRLTLSALMSRYSEEFEFDFVVAEGLLLIALVLAYQPLRNRFREALLYLVGGDVTQVRDATRQLSVELSRRSDDDVDRISAWFAEGLQKALKLRYVCLSLSDSGAASRVLRCENTESADEINELLNRNNIANGFYKVASRHLDGWVDRSRCRDAELLVVMGELDLIASFRIHYRSVDGLLLLGSPTSGDRLSDEQLNTLTLLVDQFAATVHNRQLEDARKTAERRAVQQEKLSTLGLLSGSLAHELRNPLSSIRTIATLLAEDLGTNSEHAKDVDLIVSEIDRLAQTTQRLLDFSRAPDATNFGVNPDAVIQRMMRILSHLAKQHGVTITLDLQLGDKLVNATDASLSEILFNLIKNAIEAVRETQQPGVLISTQVNIAKSDADSVATITVLDNGPGISTELQDNIFEPFVTGKADGTGLGLYLVAERVREVNGTISCTSESTGTRFEVKLPLSCKGTE